MRAHLVRDVVSATEYAIALGAWHDGGRLQGRPVNTIHVRNMPDPVAKSIARAIRKGRYASDVLVTDFGADGDFVLDEVEEFYRARAEFDGEVESAVTRKDTSS